MRCGCRCARSAICRTASQLCACRARILLRVLHVVPAAGQCLGTQSGRLTPRRRRPCPARIRSCQARGDVGLVLAVAANYRVRRTAPPNPRPPFARRTKPPVPVTPENGPGISFITPMRTTVPEICAHPAAGSAAASPVINIAAQFRRVMPPSSCQNVGRRRRHGVTRS